MQLSMEAIAEKAQMKLECVKDYDQHRNILQKQLICQYWLRGTCCFPDYFCHFAHGCKDLTYSIKSISECQEPYPDHLNDVVKFKSPRIYFVLLEKQFDPFIRKQLKEYFQQIGEPFDENTAFNNEDLKTQRKVKQVILTYTILQDIILFYELILTSLKTNKIPKSLFAHELDRTGYSLMGSKKAKPYTLIYHLQSYGICFQKNLVPDFQFKPYVGTQSVQQQQQLIPNDEQLIQQKEEDQEDNENEDDDDEQEVVTQLGDGKLTFLVKVSDLEQMKVEFIKQLKLILESHPELKQLQDFDDFQEGLYQFMQQFEHLPSLYQMLRLLNTVWGKFSQEYGFEEYQYKNSFESGISIPMIVQTFTQDQKNCLQEYLQRPKHKYFFCQYWLRGICIFQSKDCRFAHGLEDLELLLEGELDIKHLIEQQKPLRFNQKPLINHRTYRILYMYQFKMNCKLRDQFIIDNLKEYRDRIREQMLKEIVVTLFGRINKGAPLQKKVVLKFFENVGLYQKGGIDINDKKLLKILATEQLAIEREVIIEQEIVVEKEEQVIQQSKKDRKKAQKKDTYLVPLREYGYYLEKYINFIFDIILLELNQGKELPIQENSIKKHINQIDQDINLPGLYVFLRMLPQNTQTMQEFIQKSILPVSKVYLKDKVKAETYELIMENGSNLVDFEMDMAKIAISIENVYETQRKLKYLFNYEKMMKLIEIDLQEQLSQMKKDRIKSELIQFMMLQKKHLLISINGAHYFINDLQQMDQQFQMDKLCNCKKSSKFPSIIRKQPDEKLLQLIEQVQEFVDKDVRNTIIVDDQVKLDISQQILSQTTIVAIDLEGQLKAGNIWLVQLGLTVRDKRLVIIFDLMKVRYLDQDIVLYTQMTSFLETILEDEGICKVFHDCKRDSQALHKNGICPKNVADTSATYVFIKQLQLQTEFQNKYKQPKKIAQMLPGLIREIQQVQTPQINTVLKTYNAMHGGNELKLAMKSNFKGEGQFDFFARPNPEFMFYSARDVEDLVQVYLEMESLINDKRIVMEKWSRKNRGFFI